PLPRLRRLRHVLEKEGRVSAIALDVAEPAAPALHRNGAPSLAIHTRRMTLGTERLILRRWRDSDRQPFADINADLRVMEHFPATLTREESDRFLDRIEAH